MKMQTAFEISVYEQTVINIIRNLPPERIVQFVDFARFFEFKSVHENSDDPLDKEETETEEEVDVASIKGFSPTTMTSSPRAKTVVSSSISKRTLSCTSGILERSNISDSSS